MTFKNAICKVLDIIYPENLYCISCHNIIDKTRKLGICDLCIRKFLWNTGKTCNKCGKKLQEEYEDDICFKCKERKIYFNEGVSCTTYGLFEKNLMKDFKYNDNSYLGRYVAYMLYDRYLLLNWKVDMVVSVPIHSKRKKKRGYNQVSVMTKTFSSLANLKYEERLLSRIKNTKPMNGLSSSERYENIHNAFLVNSNIKVDNKNILIIDDISTTHATVNECSRVLKEKGTNNIYVLTFS